MKIKLVKCFECNGLGKTVDDVICQKCLGTGKININKIKKLKIK